MSKIFLENIMKKLALNRETVRTLDDVSLNQVAGGGGKTTNCGNTDRCLITSTVTIFTCGVSCEFCVDPTDLR